MRRTRWTSVVLPLAILACSTVPITHRKQLNLVPESTMLSMSEQQYGDFMKEHPLSADQEKTALVKRVGANIQAAVEQYFAQHGLAHELEGYRWETNLVESKEVNAWCMPGGRIVVYTGILPVARDEAGLAVVMGHEVSHAVAQHGNERMSQALLAQLGGVALETALASEPQQTKSLWMAAYGAGAQAGVLLPFSREQESEADRLGLTFMAMAGYDPGEAVAFWERMAAQKGAAPPEFLSTHPSDQTRIEDIKRLVPEAMKYYRKP
jgi:predicted Zn-dependent protease